jgi:hypothetical protein
MDRIGYVPFAPNMTNGQEGKAGYGATLPASANTLEKKQFQKGQNLISLIIFCLLYKFLTGL